MAFPGIPSPQGRKALWTSPGFKNVQAHLFPGQTPQETPHVGYLVFGKAQGHIVFNNF